MKKNSRYLLVILAAFGVVLLVHHKRESNYEVFVEEFDYGAAVEKGLPVLLVLGWKGCPACMQMKPVLEGLKEKYSDKFSVGYIDVMKDREAFKKYQVEAGPTMIFYDDSGQVLFRHIGYLSQESILAKWKEAGLAVAYRVYD